MTIAAKRQAHQTPRVTQRDRLPRPTGGSWWTGHDRESFTACAAKRFAKGDSRAIFESTEAALANRGKKRDISEVFIEPLPLEPNELSGIAVESADTETDE